MRADALASMAGATMKERAAKWPTDEVSMSTDLCVGLPTKAMSETERRIFLQKATKVTKGHG